MFVLFIIFISSEEKNEKVKFGTKRVMLEVVLRLVSQAADKYKIKEKNYTSNRLLHSFCTEICRNKERKREKVENNKQDKMMMRME